MTVVSRVTDPRPHDVLTRPLLPGTSVHLPLVARHRGSTRTAHPTARAGRRTTAWSRWHRSRSSVQRTGRVGRRAGAANTTSAGGSRAQLRRAVAPRPAWSPGSAYIAPARHKMWRVRRSGRTHSGHPSEPASRPGPCEADTVDAPHGTKNHSPRMHHCRRVEDEVSQRARR